MTHAPTEALTNTGPTGRWVLAATILASSLAFIQSTALNVALPAIQADLGASGGQLLWIVNGYLLTLAALILVGGSLGDQLGRKRVFMVGIGLFLTASLACGLAPSVEILIAARIVQGAGGAVMIPGSLAIISALFEHGERGWAIGTWTGATTIAMIAGSLLGGILADAGFWRGVFLINIPLGLAALWALYTRVPELRDEKATSKIDSAGALLAALGLAGLTYGFIAMPGQGVTDPRVWCNLVGGTAGLVAFALVEIRSDHPMLPLHLFRLRNFSGANLITLFLQGALHVASVFLSLNLIQAQGYPPTLAGLALCPFALLLAALSRWAGGLVDRIGPRLLLIIGSALTAMGYFLLGLVGLTGGPSDYWTTFLPGVALFGLGMGLTVAPLTTTVMSALPTDYAGIASGVNNAVSRTGSVLAIALIGTLALILFANALQAQTAGLELTAEARVALQAEAGNLGEAQVPAAVAEENVAAVERAIRLAFVETFQVVMFVCAGLAGASALIAAWLVGPRLVPEETAVSIHGKQMGQPTAAGVNSGQLNLRAGGSG
jgi:EmrB/QacA subfamily drug resistance transporter